MNLIRRIKKAISIFRGNPSLFFKLLIENLSSKILYRWFTPQSGGQKRVNGIIFDFDFDLDQEVIKRMYFGFYEIEIIEIMRAVLKPGDVFIDVGANIGYLSAIGAGLVGRNGEVHSFEPVPQYFESLKKMSVINSDYKIIVNQFALGEKEDKLNINITSLFNAGCMGWNTMVPGFMKEEAIKETLEVSVYRLDNYIKQKKLNNISLIKIDVEGFEFPVLKGLSDYFQNTEQRPVIICEVDPSAYPLLGYSLSQLQEYMREYNYFVYNSKNTNAKIDLATLKENTKLVFK